MRSDIVQTKRTHSIPYLPVVTRWLLLLVTGGLMFWLAGGWPPTTWALLVQCLMNFQPLWEKHQESLILPLVLLCIQSLFLLAAWGLWVWRVYCELGIPRLSVKASGFGAFRKQPPAPGPEQGAPQAVPEFKEPIPEFKVPEPIAEFKEPIPEPQAQESAPKSMVVDMLAENPFETEAEEPEPIPERKEPEVQEKPGASSEQQADMLTEKPFQAEVEEPTSPRPAVQSRKGPQVEAPREPVAVPPVAKKSEDEVLPEVKHVEPIEVTRANPFATTNPFDVQNDLITLFGQESAIEEEAETEPEPGADSLYVFGDPLAGPLPDIFYHDETLKRELIEEKGQGKKKKKGEAHRGQSV